MSQDPPSRYTVVLAPFAPKVWAPFVADLPNRLRRRTSAESYRPEIDGLRFFAIAIVVVGHFVQRADRFFPSTRDWIERSAIGQILDSAGNGVLLFFTISGFIIATQAAKAKAPLLSGEFLRKYFGRRILRIEPPYLLLLLATWALMEATGYYPEMTNQGNVPASLTLSLISSLLYMHDLIWGTFPRLFPPGWSLEVEVQFYITAPLLCWAYVATPAGLKRLTIGLSFLLLASLMPMFVGGRLGSISLQYSVLRYFDYFFLGIMIANGTEWIVGVTKSVPKPLVGAIGWLGLAGYLLLSGLWIDTPYLVFARLLGLAAIFAMFVSALTVGSSFRDFCSMKWISLVGGACYSIYLVHLQILQVLTTLIAKLAPSSPAFAVCIYGFVEIAIVLLVSIVFYALVERIFMIPHWPAIVWRHLSFRRFSSMGTEAS